MSIGTTAALVVGGLGAAGSIGSALIGANAAGKAASQTTGAAQQAIDETQNQFNTTQANLAPYMQAGTGALAQLTAGTAPGGSLITPYGPTYQTPTPFSYAAFQAPAPFTAPTLDNTNDPGYAFRLQQGEQALQRGAAAAGGAFSGGTLAALTRYGQDYASNEYQNVYNRALQGYQTNFGDSLNAYQTNLSGALNAYNTNVNTGLNAYNTQLNAYNTGQQNAFARLLALSGMGQSAVNTGASLGANNAAAIANLLTGKGQAAAAGTLGQAQAWNAGLNGILGNPFLTGGLASLITGTPAKGAGSGEGPQIGNQTPILDYSSYSGGYSGE